MNRHHSWLALGLLAVFAVLLAPMDRPSSLWVRQLQDSGHGPLFALVSAGTLAWLRYIKPTWARSSHYLIAFLFALLIGGAGELAQVLLTASRNAEWGDLAIDAWGAILGLGLMALKEPAARLHSGLKFGIVWPALLVVGCAILWPVAQLTLAYWQRQHQLPDLLTLDTPRGMHFAQGSGASVSRTAIADAGTAGSRLALTITPHPQATWPGIAIEQPWPDWSRYRALEVVVQNPNSTPLTLNVRIDDIHHNQQYTDRFNDSAWLPPGQDTRLLIDINRIQHGPVQRKLDVRNIAQVILFEQGGPQARPFILRRIRLVN